MLLIVLCVVCVHEVYQWTEGVESYTFGGFVAWRGGEVDWRRPRAAKAGSMKLWAFAGNLVLVSCFSLMVL